MKSELADRINNLPKEVKDKLIKRLAAEQVMKKALADIGRLDLLKKLNEVPVKERNEVLKEISIVIKRQ